MAAHQILMLDQRFGDVFGTFHPMCQILKETVLALKSHTPVSDWG